MVESTVGSVAPRAAEAEECLLRSPSGALRIGIDAHSIGSGKGGNETHFTELVRWLARVDHHNQYFVLGCRKNDFEASLGSNGNFRFGAACSNRYRRIFVSLPSAARRERLDIFHAQSFPPPFLKCRLVTTILDLAFEHYPQFFRASETAWMKVLIRHAARSSDHIFTASEHGKNDLVSMYQVNPDKITVTPLAAAEEFYPRDRAESKTFTARKYGIEVPFLLYVGRLQARKNLVGLVDAYDQARRRGVSHKLLLVGKKDSGAQALFRRVDELALCGQVIFAEHVAWADLPYIYSAADAFVYPSFFEGFGLPVVEAMTCGTPVITSRGSSLEEISGDAALLVDPFDVTAIRHAIEKVLSDGECRERLVQAGLRRSSQFSFEVTARKTMETYRQIAGA